ncbi:MAG: hypothetical protein JWN70_4944 [Planctomycetaceae bacterium]|nr:hypothetical protein [Planctomycetaceae bacterium]
MDEVLIVMRLDLSLVRVLAVGLMLGFCPSLHADEEQDAPFIPGSSLIDFALSDDIRTSLWPDVNAPEIAALRRLSQAQRKEYLALYVDPSEEDQANPRGMADRVRAKYLPELKKALPPEQFTRLQQIRWQYDGLSVVLDPEMVQVLGITKEQLEKLVSGEAELSPSNMKNIQKVQGLTAEERSKIHLEMHQKWYRKIHEVLSADQAAKLVEVKGPQFSPTNRGAQPPIKFSFSQPTNMILLATQKLVQAELGIATDSAEVVALDKLWELKRQERSAKVQNPFGVSFDHLNAKDEFQLRKVLNPEQMNRLRQIDLQYTAMSPFQIPYLQKALSLNSDQRDKLETLYRDVREKTAALRKSSEVPESEMLGKRRALQAEAQQKTNEILAAEQVKKLAELEGKPFDIDRLKATMAEEAARRKRAEK